MWQRLPKIFFGYWGRGIHDTRSMVQEAECVQTSQARRFYVIQPPCSQACKWTAGTTVRRLFSDIALWYCLIAQIAVQILFPTVELFSEPNNWLIIFIPILMNCYYTLPSMNISLMKNWWVFTSLSRTNIRITFLFTFDEFHCIYHW